MESLREPVRLRALTINECTALKNQMHAAVSAFARREIEPSAHA